MGLVSRRASWNQGAELLGRGRARAMRGGRGAKFRKEGPRAGPEPWREERGEAGVGASTTVTAVSPRHCPGAAHFLLPVPTGGVVI